MRDIKENLLKRDPFDQRFHRPLNVRLVRKYRSAITDVNLARTLLLLLLLLLFLVGYISYIPSLKEY